MCRIIESYCDACGNGDAYFPTFPRLANVSSIAALRDAEANVHPKITMFKTARSKHVAINGPISEPTLELRELSLDSKLAFKLEKN